MSKGNIKLWVESIVKKGVVIVVKLMKVNRAKEEVKRLQDYINLVESYQTDTLKKKIIKEYAYTNSVAEIVRNYKKDNILYNGYTIDKDFVISVLTGKASDPLHRLIKISYLTKIKKIREDIYNKVRFNKKKCP